MSPATAASEALHSAEPAAGYSSVVAHTAHEANTKEGCRAGGYRQAGRDNRKPGGAFRRSRRRPGSSSPQNWRLLCHLWDSTLVWGGTLAWGCSLAGLGRLGSLGALRKSHPKLHDAERGPEVVEEEGRNNLVADRGCLGGRIGCCCCCCCCFGVVRRRF